MEVDGRSTGYVLNLKVCPLRREATRAAGEMEGADMGSRAREIERARARERLDGGGE